MRPTPVLIGTTEGTIYPCRMENKFGERQYTEVILSIVSPNGEQEARCLLDTSCTRLMILKNFTDPKQRTNLSQSNTIEYERYDSTFKLSMTASIDFKIVEFEQHKHQTVEFEFQVDETSNPKKVG